MKYTNGGVAQLGEHLPCKQGVKSSNLSISIVSGSWHKTNRNENMKENTFFSQSDLFVICTLKTEYWKIKYQNNDKRDIRDLNK